MKLAKTVYISSFDDLPGHEVIRGCMKDIQAALDDNDLVTAKSLWDDLQRWDNIHMKMEEGEPDGPKGIFGILDEYADGLADKKGLRHHHQHLYEYEEDIHDAFTHAADVSEAVKASYECFQKENLSHLEAEENAMMPAIQGLSKAGKPMKKFMCQEVFPLIPANEVEFFIKFANQVLVRHEGGMPRVRVFNHALWVVGTASNQWGEWEAWIQEVLPTEKFGETRNAIEVYQAYKKATSSDNTPPMAIVEGKPRGGGIGQGIKRLLRRNGSSSSSTASSSMGRSSRS